MRPPRRLGQTEEINETSSVDTQQLFRVCAGRIACTVARMALQKISRRVERTLNRRIRRWHASQVFAASARLDLPTFRLRSAQSRLTRLSTRRQSFLWQAINKTLLIFSGGLRLGAQTFALTKALSGHREEQLLTWTTMAAESLILLPHISSFAPDSGE